MKIKISDVPTSTLTTNSYHHRYHVFIALITFLFISLSTLQGRGLADQVRWMLAATNVSFTHCKISSREAFLTLKVAHNAFGQMPLLQIGLLMLFIAHFINHKFHYYNLFNFSY